MTQELPKCARNTRAASGKVYVYEVVWGDTRNETSSRAFLPCDREAAVAFYWSMSGYAVLQFRTVLVSVPHKGV